jgi:hypothetical protein
MNIEGWAFKEQERLLALKNRKNEFMFAMKNKASYVQVESVTHGYAHQIVKGILLPGHPPIGEEELAVFLDEGNLCFGGVCTISGDKFTCKIYTD